MNEDVEQKRLEMLEHYNTLSPSDKENLNNELADILANEIDKEIKACISRGEVKVENGVTTYGN